MQTYQDLFGMGDKEESPEYVNEWKDWAAKSPVNKDMEQIESVIKQLKEKPPVQPKYLPEHGPPAPK